MNEIIDFLKKLAEMDEVVAAAITGVFTFFITKYTYHKNIPLDKFETAYDKVYYPIYCLLRSKESKEKKISESEKYLSDNAKFVDKSTIIAFRYLSDSDGKQKDKAYNNFVNNVYSLDTKLRRRLGYLEPNIFTLYTYSNPSEKRVIRMIIELMGGYIPLAIMSVIDDEKLNAICVVICMLLWLAFVLEVIYLIVIFVIKIIGKVFVFGMNIAKKGFEKLRTIYKKIKNSFIYKRGRKKQKEVLQTSNKK